MARGRMLLKRISMSEKVNKSLSCDAARLLYTWLLAHLDCNGCYYADPIIVRNTVFPWREDVSVKSVGKYLEEMADCALIVLYESGGKYLYFPDFEDKQPKINKDKEGKTDIPEPTPELLRSSSRVTPSQSKIKEDKIKEDKTKSPSPDGSASPLLNYLLENISNGLSPYQNKLVEFFNYRQAKLKKDRFGSRKGIDGLIRECRKCLSAYADLNECLDVTMERNWKIPDPEYLRGKVVAFDAQTPSGEPF